MARKTKQVLTTATIYSLSNTEVMLLQKWTKITDIMIPWLKLNVVIKLCWIFATANGKDDR